MEPVGNRARARRTASTSWSTRSRSARWRGPPPPTSGTRASPAWCAYAAGKGWVDADGGVVAHIERTRRAGLKPRRRPGRCRMSSRPGAATLVAPPGASGGGGAGPLSPGEDTWRFGTTTACSSAATGSPRRAPTPSARSRRRPRRSSPGCPTAPRPTSTRPSPRRARPSTTAPGRA